MLAFNLLGVYLLWLYLSISTCNPGRIESEDQKKFLNDRFGRLFLEL